MERVGVEVDEKQGAVVKEMALRRAQMSINVVCDEGSSNGGFVLEKGPWTSAEDAILVDYVKKHEESNWNAVQ
ncbi:transcription factor GAMYB [Olea europaea subsp. europaea]|uniref:Transcription factor GAMYB n=1 Tax=Olea europaea subsp. europaea TaxID=158383 RepID=A0A8S0QC97_OLEEU|nr:transcription factor GAMYB [Olea europaea subsp. europaea]